MPVPKNLVTTNRLARVVRREYRHRVRPAAIEGVISLRRRRANDRSNAPDYLILGVNKAGTTALFESLVSLPGVGTPLRKEVHYFDQRPQAGDAWYRAHFWGDGRLLWGEGTPEYLEAPGAVEGVRRVAPNAKLIVCLRDPVKRAVSHFYNAVDHGVESRSLERAVSEEVARLEDGWRPSSVLELRSAYVYRSRYVDTLAPWLAAFPRERILVLVSERRSRLVSDACDFLGLRAPETSDGRDSNSRSYNEPSRDVVAQIAAATAQSTAALPDLLGWDRVPEEWV